MSLIDNRPAQRRELVQERLFDMEVLGHGLSGCGLRDLYADTARQEIVH